MNFNYSYRALVITCLLFGMLYVGFTSIKLSRYLVHPEDSYKVEYIDEDKSLANDLKARSNEFLKIESNRAYNEAEDFISEAESDRQKSNIETEVSNGITQDGSNDIETDKSIIEEPDIETLDSEDINNREKSVSDISKKNSTVNYRLVDRRALILPNPVYTCNGSGKVYLNIEVDASGKVLRANYNSEKSTTTNQCLIENAVKYAKEAVFTTKANKAIQLGSITYYFPGQN